ncbi:hypothetical protein CEXT_426491 [Caerostris extrusa]|uniref:Uncharacterized protein n=1 Tax=Caerostris extrusa TaxID=172846 RepID=A0AAV4Y1Y8_CAEEX|nr:hypothetical protein CEXT_426491 [Caerostris extrusa]
MVLKIAVCFHPNLARAASGRVICSRGGLYLSSSNEISGLHYTLEGDEMDFSLVLKTVSNFRFRRTFFLSLRIRNCIFTGTFRWTNEIGQIQKKKSLYKLFVVRKRSYPVLEPT